MIVIIDFVFYILLYLIKLYDRFLDSDLHSYWFSISEIKEPCKRWWLFNQSGVDREITAVWRWTVRNTQDEEDATEDAARRQNNVDLIDVDCGIVAAR